MKSVSRILVIQTAFLGDVILSLPMIQTIKNYLPESEIDYLCIPNTSVILNNSPYISQLLVYDKKQSDQFDKFIEVICLIRERNYDAVLSPHRSLRSTLLAYYSGSGIRIGFDKNSFSFFYTDRVIYRSELHEILRNNMLAELLLKKYAKKDDIEFSLRAEIYPSEDDKNYVHALLPFKNYVVLAPCSRWYTKQLTPVKSAAIISTLIRENYKVVLIGTADDMNYFTEVKKITSVEFLDLSGRLNPLQAYYAISLADGLITVDSASQHLGAAAGVPVILIYGSTDKSFGFYPLTGKYRICEVPLECRPCTDHGRMSCPEKHFRCINDISEENVLKMLGEIICNK